MILGETEHIIAKATDHDEYDHFALFGKQVGKKRDKSPEAVAARKAKRQAFWQKAGQAVKNAGGEGGIGQTLGNVIGFFKPTDPTTEDYQIGMAGNPPESEKKGIPTNVMIIGGVIFLVGGLWAYSQYQKNQQLKLAQINQ